MSCEINLRFRRFSSSMGQITGPTTYYIAPMPQNAPRASSVPRALYLANMSLETGPATISASTITMDHGAIICSMTDRLLRGPDQDVHDPSVGSPKYPSRRVELIYL